MISPNHKPWYEPPRWADKLIERLCAPYLHEEVMGDLHERYQLQVEKLGEKRARRRYFRESLAFMRASVLKRKPTPHTNPMLITMLRHYLITALRNTSRNKAFSAINVTGLALGMTCFLLIFLWVADERTIDNFHEHNEDLYVLYQTIHSQDGVIGSYQLQEYGSLEHNYYADIDVHLKDKFPEVLYATQYATSYELPWGRSLTLQYGDDKHKLNGGTAGIDFFKMFNYPLLAGSAENALKEVNTIAISEKVSGLFFNSPEEAIGQILRYDNGLDLKVTAVFKETDNRSTLQFDYLISWKNTVLDQILLSEGQYETYVQLKPGSNPELFAAKIKDFQNEQFDYTDGYRCDFGIQPFGERYLVSNFENGKPTSGRIEYINIFSGVAAFILLIACINFMNLATAKSLKRAKEVGVRKVVGSSRSYLIGQFLGESLILAFMALALSLVIIFLLLPYFNNFSGKNMTLPLDEGSYWLFLIGLTVVAGLASGSYPALFLSSLRPVRVLKGITRFGRSASWFRKGLAIFQFSLSILLLIGTLVVSRQTHYVQNKHLGYDRENVIYVKIEGDMNNRYQVYKERLLSMPGIAMVDRSSEAPHNMGFEMSTPFKWEGQQEGQFIGFRPTSVGFDFLEMMDLEVVEGRGFNKDIVTDTSAFMVNETALKQMGMTDPLGKWISAWDKKGKIIGIVKDYHIASLHEPIKPLILDVKEGLYFGIIMIKTQPGKTVEALKSLETATAEINPDYPLDYQFMDQEYAKLYESEAIISKISNVFAALAVIISCLGLLGLAMFSAEQKVKEIGIRKVLGASVNQIISLFSREFIQLVLLSFIIASPLAWYLMKEWLNGFAYSIPLAWWFFALTGLAALGIAMLTVSVQTLKAATSNPVKSLRTE